MQAVRELDQDDARVLRDRQQQLAVVLDLPLLRRVRRQRPDLGESVDDLGDLAPELPLHVVDRDRGVLDDIVDQSARDGDRVELQIREDLRDLDAVRDVILARQTLLPEVRPLAEPVGAREQVLVESLGASLVDDVPVRDDLLCNATAVMIVPSCDRGTLAPSSIRCSAKLT